MQAAVLRLCLRASLAVSSQVSGAAKVASAAALLQPRIYSDIAQPAADDGSLLSEWINPQYLDESLQAQAEVIRAIVLEDSLYLLHEIWRR